MMDPEGHTADGPVMSKIVLQLEWVIHAFKIIYRAFAFLV